MTALPNTVGEILERTAPPRPTIDSRQQPPFEWEPDDAELGWEDDDSVPVNIFGETDEEETE